MKLKMFLMLLAISVAHRKIDHFNISNLLKAPLIGIIEQTIPLLKGPNRRSKIFFKHFFFMGGFFGPMRGAVQSLLHFGWKKKI
jgi:hypothetical protein